MNEFIMNLWFFIAINKPIYSNLLVKRYYNLNKGYMKFSQELVYLFSKNEEIIIHFC